jgi:hypothetical protein
MRSHCTVKYNSLIPLTHRYFLTELPSTLMNVSYVGTLHDKEGVEMVIREWLGIQQLNYIARGSGNGHS